jgi:hypothetical protein
MFTHSKKSISKHHFFTSSIKILQMQLPWALEHLWPACNTGDASFSPSNFGGTNYALGVHPTTAGDALLGAQFATAVPEPASVAVTAGAHGIGLGPALQPPLGLPTVTRNGLSASELSPIFCCCAVQQTKS